MSAARKSRATASGAPADDAFTFEISLSVLNHLGRSLYRSFATVLGEAISNSWDADAKNVEILIDKRKNSFLIIDDGVGMTSADFQNKFLRIGYSKRKAGRSTSESGRPFVGRKGIGKLALLSCADRITVVSRVEGGQWIGGVIDNSGLDEAITEDLKPQQYPLGKWKAATFRRYTRSRKHGTVIYFDGLKKGIKTSFPLLEKIIALHFRFALIDAAFRISLNGTPITHKHLKELAAKTEFLWKVGDPEDPFIDDLEARFKTSPDHDVREIEITGVTGFVASVEKPRDLKIFGTEERVGVDLLVNGRLRERDILKHIPTAQIAESYLYGQIHFDALDDKTDRFTSSREGIVADDPKYAKFLETFRREILKIVNEWDEMRTSRRKEGDPENPRLTPKQRASRGLFGAVSQEYALPKGSQKQDTVARWVDDLSEDAAFNFESYADCFVSENLVRRYITTRKVPLSPQARLTAQQWKAKERANKGKGNISIAIRRDPSDPSYLSMDDLAYLVDKRDPQKEACLARDANEYKPIRDAMAHTALLTPNAKTKLSTVRANIKERVKTILSTKK